MRNFGLGSLWSIPSGATPAPLRFATLKDISLDIGGDLELLRGEGYFAVDAGKKGGAVKGKIGLAELNMGILSQIIPGIVKTTGTTRVIIEEAGTIPSTPFQITVAQGATFLENLEVINGVTGLPMTRGATATGTGVYAVNDGTGVYTFHTSDTGKAVRISYRYTVAGSGSTYTISNSVSTVATPFVMLLGNGTSGKYFSARVPSVHVPGIGFGLKGDGWTEYQLNYEATADSAGKCAYLYSDDS